MYHELLRMDQIRRRIHFPYPLHQFSYSVGIRYGTRPVLKGVDLEFCIRIASPEPYAEDVFDGVSYRSPFPFLLIKPPEVTHVNNIQGVREALSLTWHRDLYSQFEALGFPLEPPGWEIDITPRISRRIAELRDLVQNSQMYGVADRIDIEAFQLIEELLLQRENVKQKIPETEKKIRRIASYFLLHFPEITDLAPLLRQYGFSRRNFYRLWSRYYDCSPKEYISNLKFNEAARLLHHSDMTVDEVMSHLNISDRTQFYKTFRERFQMSPAAYRKGWKE